MNLVMVTDDYAFGYFHTQEVMKYIVTSDVAIPVL